MPFSTDIGLDFCIFPATYKESKKFNIYISGEAVHSQMARQRDHQTGKMQTFYRTTTL